MIPVIERNIFEVVEFKIGREPREPGLHGLIQHLFFDICRNKRGSCGHYLVDKLEWNIESEILGGCCQIFAFHLLE